MSNHQCKIAVAIPTFGRRKILSSTLDTLAEQTRLPDSLIICRSNPADVDEDELKKFSNVTLTSAAVTGLAHQRNQIMSHCRDADVIVFFDDDFFPEREYLKVIEEIFAANTEVVAATGALLADGAQGPGISVEAGLEMTRTAPPFTSAVTFEDVYGTYGCNMAFRLKPIIENNIMFDENLPLYGWQEDIDFARSLSAFGRIVKSESLRGVHLGVKVGRTSGVRFGYSQISNPLFLIRKGTMSWRHASKLMWRNLAANTVRSFRPEPWIDRRGRLRGNILALLDLTKGRIQPDRILKLD